jgi:hypothetical protein
LTTCLASALFFNPDEEANADIWLALWAVFVNAALANVLLLPFKYLLPCVGHHPSVQVLLVWCLCPLWLCWLCWRWHRRRCS